MLGELVQHALHFDEQLLSHFPRKAVADEDALDHEVFAVGRHGVGGHKPTTFAQLVGEIVEREGRRCRVFELPAEAGDSTLAGVDDVEWTEPCDLVGEILAECRALCLDLAVASLPRRKKVVVLDRMISPPGP